MRTVCFVVFVTSVLFNASAATALTNEVLYRWCKSYADSGFNSTSDEALLCKAYIIGAMDYAKGVCYTMETQAKKDASQAFTRSFFGASSDANSNALIQAYVNKMKNEPNKWDYTPNAALRQVFNELAPCK
jgi:archaellum component FlaG (FlaF/FlaG flagellin family)